MGRKGLVMRDCRFLPETFNSDDAASWVAQCAKSSGWTSEEADRLAYCVSDSAFAVSERAYRLRERGPVFVKLEVGTTEAMLELHHEGAIGDKPCDCAAAKKATSRKSSVWLDGQLRTHQLRIARA